MSRAGRRNRLYSAPVLGSQATMTLSIPEYRRRLGLLYRQQAGIPRPASAAETEQRVEQMQALLVDLARLERELAEAIAALGHPSGVRRLLTTLFGHEEQTAARLQACRQLEASATALRRHVERETLPALRRRWHALSLVEAEKRTTIDYDAYIYTKAWRQKATAAKEAAGYRCRLCHRSGDEVRLEVHHLTYERLGNEQLMDIAVLCPDCYRFYEAYKGRIRGTRTCKTCGRTFTPLYPTHVTCRHCYFPPATSLHPNGRRPRPTHGHCIRCRTPIPLAPDLPYCPDCHRVWKRYRNATQPELYCHVCGEQHATSMEKPACYECYQGQREVLAFAGD